MDTIARMLGREVVKYGGKVFATHGLAKIQDDPEGTQEFVASASHEGGRPSKVDLRQYCTPVEDQSNSNSCCANAVAGAYEYLACRAALKTGDDVGDVSRLFIYFVGRKADMSSKNCRVKDEGMSLQGAITALKAKGACLERDWPFDLANVNTPPVDPLYEKAMYYKISDSMKVPVDADAMKDCLAEGFPIVFGLKLTERFFRPGRSGRIAVPDPGDAQSAEHGLHAMLCVGYCDEDEVFIVRNSWGEDWGHGGYCYVPYAYMANSDFNFCGQYAIKGLTDYDLTPETPVDGGSVFVNDDDDDDGPLDLEREVRDRVDDEDSDNEYDDYFDEQAEIRRVFHRFDADGSGNLSRKELQKCLQCCGMYLPSIVIAGISKTYNTDGEAGISLEEFEQIFHDMKLQGQA